MKREQIVHVSFYFSDSYGSEYLAAHEQHLLLRKRFCVDLISSNLEHNVFDIVPKDRLKIISSPVRKQKILYRWTDVLPQILWHLSVYCWLKSLTGKQKVFISGVMPWIPSFLYNTLGRDVVFLGVGGSKNPINYSIKEIIRLTLSKVFLKLFALTDNNIMVVPRTTEAFDLWNRYATNVSSVIPERVNPIDATVHIVNQKDNVVFLWIGQDIPRKRLDLGLNWFNMLKSELPAHLHVYGAEGSADLESVTFHGWVSSIDYEKLGTKLVLLLSSDREGLPSSVIEILQKGGMIITKNIGSLAALRSERIIFVSEKDAEWKDIASLIKMGFSSEFVNVQKEEFSNLYNKIL